MQHLNQHWGVQCILHKYCPTKRLMYNVPQSLPLWFASLHTWVKLASS